MYLQRFSKVTESIRAFSLMVRTLMLCRILIPTQIQTSAASLSIKPHRTASWYVAVEAFFYLFLHILSCCKFDLSSLLQENRKLKFWFVKGADDFRKMTVTYEFFKELVRPGFFPRGKAIPIPFIFFLNVCTFFDLSCSYRLCWLHQESDEADAGPSICQLESCQLGSHSTRRQPTRGLRSR